MSSVSLVLDSLPSHFGLRSGDWAGLFVSRVVARPLVEKFNGKYCLGILSEVKKVEPFTWRLVIAESKNYTASSLLSSWRTSASHGHAHAMRFLRRVHVVDKNTLDVVCQREYETILPFLDSPWLWAAMDKASTLKVIRADGDYEFTLESDVELVRSKLQRKQIILLHEMAPKISKTQKWLSAGLPTPLLGCDTMKPIDIFFTLAPNSKTTHLGPFLCKDVVQRILQSIDQLKLLDTSWNEPSSANHDQSIPSIEAVTKVITKLSYTDFFPNEVLANIIRTIVSNYYQQEIILSRSTYCDITPEYSRDRTAADILPIVPNNSAPTSIVWEMLTLTDALLNNETKNRVQSELDSIEENLHDSSSLTKVKELIDLIASSTGFGILGRYRGYYTFNQLPEIPISDFGFIDLEGVF